MVTFWTIVRYEFQNDVHVRVVFCLCMRQSYVRWVPISMPGFWSFSRNRFEILQHAGVGIAAKLTYVQSCLDYNTVTVQNALVHRNKNGVSTKLRKMDKKVEYNVRLMYINVISTRVLC